MAQPAPAPTDRCPIRFRSGALREVGRRVVGQDVMVERLMVGLLTGGHILLEGVPGLAKTLAVRTLAEIISATFSRIQFTPDLLPADVIGTMVFDLKTQEFRVKKGPLFAQHRPGRRDQPRAGQGAVRAARGDAGAPGHDRRNAPTRCQSRSSCSRPRTRSRARAPIRCPRRSSTGSSSRCVVGYPGRTRSGRCSSG